MKAIWIVGASAIAVMGVVGGVHLAGQRLRAAGRRQRPRPSDVGIILGAYTQGYQPSAPLLARLKKGLQLYRSGYVPCLIVSGGRGEDETVTESRSMKRFLILNGVPPDAVLEDRRATDTWENLRNSTRLMADHDLRSAVVVTSDYHLPRALAVARQLGMDVSGIAASSRSGELRFALREVVAWGKYVMSGQVSLRGKS